MNVIGRRLLSGALTCALLLGQVPGASAAGAQSAQDTQTPGLGTVSMEWSRDIYNGITLDHVASENEHGLQKSYTVTYDPQTTQIRPILNYGPYVMGGEIMSDMVAQVEADGSKVVFAINGDAYDTSNGVSNGLMIKNGVLISTSYNNSAEAVGFKADGTADTAEIGKALQAAPEGVRGIDADEEGGAGALTGLDASMEYKAADADEWTGAEGETAEGLAPGNYRVRYAGTDTQAPSAAVAVSILDFEAPERNETPEAEFDASSMTLSNLAAGQAYSLDGGATWNDAGGDEVQLCEEDVTVEQGIRIYVPGVEGESSDSDEQFISLARAEAPTGVGRIGQTAAASGALTGVDSSMEYRAQDDAEWTAVDGDADTVEVAPGVYLVRAAGSGTVLASQSIPVAVAAYAAPGATGITLDQTSLRLYHNASPRTAILTASVLPEGAKQTVTWSSSDEGVATVEDGLVRAVAEGTAVITVTSADGGFTAQCSVRVRTRHASSKDSGSSGSGSGSAGGSAATPEVPAEPAQPVVPDEPAAPEAPAPTFADVEGHWAAESIAYVARQGLMKGTSETAFDPDGTMSRAMLLTVLYRMDGGKDSGTGAAWYSDALSWAVERGVSDGSNPEGSVTREQLATLLYRYAGSPASGGGTAAYGDSGQVSAWAADAMAWAVSGGLISGKPGSLLDPQGTATRAEVAAILMRFAEQNA